MFSSKENENQNISFLLEEKGDKQEGNEFNLTTMIHEMDDLLQYKGPDNYNNNNSELLYYVEKNVFVNEYEIYYNEK